jgi:putative ABC transport system permease protein
MSWRFWFQQRKWERQMDAEFRFHLESQINDYMRQGLSRRKAELRARREFGALELAKDECRDQRPLEWAADLLRDVRYSARSLRRTPGFTVAAIVTLALGIGANTAIFSVVHAVLLRSLPYPEPNRLVRVALQGTQGDVTIPQYEFWKEHAPAFASVAGYRGGGDGSLVFGASREWVQFMLVTTDFFRTLGVTPALGREFHPAETRPNGPQAIILSDSLWRRAFAADPGVLGRVVTIEDANYSVVGVSPHGFWFPQTADVFVPLRPTGSASDNGSNTDMIARLKPGVSFRQAQASMAPITESFRRALAGDELADSRGLSLIPYQEWLTGDVRLKLLLLFGTVGLLLLIACSNVASLLVARLAARQREIAIRMALGGSSGRLLRQFLAENILLAMGGGIAGLLGAYWLLDWLLFLMPFQLPVSAPIRLDLFVLAFTLAISLGTALIFSLAPLVAALRLDIYDTLRAAGHSSAPSAARYNTRSFLVVTEVALSVTLLVGAALLIQSLYRLHREPLGFTPEHLITFETRPSDRREKAGELRNFEAALAARIRALPGVRGVAGANVVPLTDRNNFPAQREAHPEQSIGGMEIRTITPEYFNVMRIPVCRGRVFTSADISASKPVILVNETLARQWWAQGNPLGDRIIIGRFNGHDLGGAPDPPREVVGVVGDTKTVYLKAPPRPTVYIPATQFDNVTGAWVVRASVIEGLADRLRKLVAEIDPGQRVQRMQTMEQIVISQTADSRFDAWLFGGFAGLALLLTTVGVYGLLAFSVARRTNEIGIRMALGARRADVLRLILRQGLTLVAIGLVTGLAAAAILTRSLSSLLFGVRPTDPLSYLAVSALLLCISVLASYLPARRAMKVETTVALRCE